MNRAKLSYELVIASSTLLGGLVGSSTFAYESRHDRLASMIGSAVFGAAIGTSCGFVLGATSPITIPGIMIGTAWGLSEDGSKKMIEKSNAFLAREHGYPSADTSTKTTN